MAHFWTAPYVPLYDTEARPRLRYAAGFALGYIVGAAEYLPGADRWVNGLRDRLLAAALTRLHPWACDDGYDAVHYHAGSIRGDRRI